MPRLDRMCTWLTPTLAAIAMLAGCALPLDHAACPCAEGWVCCASSQVCVAESAACPGDAPEAPEIQRLSLDQQWAEDNFGSSVALAGDLAAVGVPGADQAATDAGAVALFERRGSGTGVWVRVAVITAPDASAYTAFGTAVALVGQDVLVVGAPSAGADRTGRVYVFRRGGDGWAWHQTIEPDLTVVAELNRATLQFGQALAADGDRFIIGTHDSTAQLYQITSEAAVHVALLTAFVNPNWASFWTGVAIHGSSALLHENSTRGVYVFDEALGWAGTRVAELPFGGWFPRTLAFDGQRIAMPGNTGAVRILERTATGWGTPTEVYLPNKPSAWLPQELAWRGDDLIMTTQLYGGDALGNVLGMARLRSAGGTWQSDPIIERSPPSRGLAPLAVSGDRALLGDATAGVAGFGSASVLGLVEPGYAEEATISFDDRHRQSFSWIAGDDHHILLRGTAEKLAWFAADNDGRYRAHPSLVLAPHSRLGWLSAVSGSHVLASLDDADGLSLGVQPFELGEQDGVAGALLAAPDDGIDRFPAQLEGAVAIDGDTAVIGAQTPHGRGVAFVYTWSSAGWQHSATLPSPDCAPSVAIAGPRIALFCDGVFSGIELSLFERTADTWAQMPAPVLLDQPDRVYRLQLSGDRAAIVTQVAAAPGVVSDVFRWADGGWRNELHLRTASGGLGALAKDRLVMYRDATSVTPYRFVDGAWTEQSPLVLPPRPRPPDARVQDILLSDTQVVVSVESDGGEPTSLQGAIYVFPWR